MGAAWCCSCNALYLLVTTVNPTETDKPIEISLVIWTRVGQRKGTMLGGIPDPCTGRALWGPPYLDMRRLARGRYPQRLIR